MSFDEQPDPDPHGECAAEIARLSASVEYHKGMAAKWESEAKADLARIRELEAALRQACVLVSPRFETPIKEWRSLLNSAALAAPDAKDGSAVDRGGEP